MKVILASTNKDMVDSWKQLFGNNASTPVVEGDVIQAGILHEAKAIVSPANSFGFMDGGVDLRYRQFFGKDLEERVIRKIKTNYDGELLVGQATFVLSGSKKIDYVISAPTMRVPSNVANTPNAYLSFRAALRMAQSMRVDSLVTPAMCIGTGEMPTDIAAAQMFIAYNEVLKGKIPEYPNLWAAMDNQIRLVKGIV